MGFDEHLAFSLPSSFFPPQTATSFIVILIPNLYFMLTTNLFFFICEVELFKIFFIH